MNEVRAAGRTRRPARSPVEAAAGVEAARRCANATSRGGLKVAKTSEDREAVRADPMAEVKTITANRAEAAADAEAMLRCADATSRGDLKVAKTSEDREAARVDPTAEVKTSTAHRTEAAAGAEGMHKCGAVTSRDGMRTAMKIENPEVVRCGGIAATIANGKAARDDRTNGTKAILPADAEAAHSMKAAPMTGAMTMITITSNLAAPTTGKRMKKDAEAASRCASGTRTIEAGGSKTMMTMIIGSRAEAAAGVALQPWIQNGEEKSHPVVAGRLTGADNKRELCTIIGNVYRLSS